MFTFAFLFTWKMQTFGMAETFEFIGELLPYTLNHTNVYMFTENEKVPFRTCPHRGVRKHANMQTFGHCLQTSDLNGAHGPSLEVLWAKQ